MVMKHYDLLSNMRLRGRWVLADPVDEHGQEVDPWQFDKGCFLNPRGQFVLRQAHPGSALDFSFTTLTIPVVHGRVVSLCECLGLQAQVQFLPARVEGQSEPYFILNALRVIRCIDDARCEEVRYWRPEDGDFGKVGQYRVVWPSSSPSASSKPWKRRASQERSSSRHRSPGVCMLQSNRAADPVDGER